MKVDQETDAKIQESKIGEQLRLIHGVKRLFALDLDYYLLIDDQVSAKAALELHHLIYEWHWFLALHKHAQFLKFIRKASFIGGF